MISYRKKKHNLNSHIKKTPLTFVQKTIIFVIVFLIFVVSATIISVILLKPERIVKNKITELATEYYEDYLYENLTNYDYPQDLNEAMKKYEDSGLSTIYLRQLLYYKDQDTDIINYLKKYCNENKTSIKIFPISPYSKTSYHIKYTYSCNF